MLSMQQHELIRRMVLVDGLSQREVASRLGHSRKTVAKALRSPAPTGYTLAQPRPRPKLSPYVPIVRQWLTEDLSRNRKQRHSAVRVFERLRDEHGYAGSRRAVSDLVKELRGELTTKDVYVPIDHPPGAEVQVDWGQADVILNGQTTRVMLFCARLPFSKATFVRAYWREDQPSFLDGHLHLIEYLGGVPNTFAYDNLKSAVTKVTGNKRSLNKKFLELRSHYLFQSRFCNVARGNEKGHTENSVKRAQRSYLTPPPQVTSIDALNEHLLDRCRDDLNRIDSVTGKTYGTLLETERSHFAPIPPTPFAACINRTARVDSHATVCFEGCRYSVPCKYACLHSVVRVWIDKVEVIIDNEVVATHRRGDAGQWMLDLEHYLPMLDRKPGLLDSGKPFVKSQFSDAEQLLRRELEYRYGEDGTRQFVNILLLSKEHEFSLVRQAIAACAKSRAFHEEAVRLELIGLKSTPTSDKTKAELDLSDRPELGSVTSDTRNLSIYDSLIDSQDVHDSEHDVSISVSLPWSENHDSRFSQLETSFAENGVGSNQAEAGDATKPGNRPEASQASHVLGGVFFTLCSMLS